MYQSVTIVGNLGKDPEMKYLPSGKPVTSMNVATSRSYKGSDGQRVNETTWFRVSVFGTQSESCAQYLKKGSKVLVEGRLTPDPKTGGPRTFSRQDGTSGASYEVLANTVRFLDSKSDGDNKSEKPAQAEEEENIPF